MGTGADFYIGTDPETMEWLGSIAWDGYPEGIISGPGTCDPKDSPVLKAPTEIAYREALEDFFSDRNDITRPEDGWPWPWENSRTTDFAYTFDGRYVLCSNFGSPWQVATEYKDLENDEDPEKVEFPDMTRVKQVTFGKRSGLIVVHARPDGSIEMK